MRERRARMEILEGLLEWPLEPRERDTGAR